MSYISKILNINILLFIALFNYSYATTTTVTPTYFTDFQQSETANIQLSVIVPLAPNETAWKALLEDLTMLPDNTEILFVTSNQTKTYHQITFASKNQIRWLSAKPGRASQMNAGAEAAKGDYLWFLHADSKFTDNTIPSLLQAIKNHPDSLLFFDLVFLKDATPLMHLNTWGAYFRSRVLKVPFGDQGFCINKNLFKKLGMYSEKLPYGEDHVFVWKAKQQDISIQPIGSILYTSARKYRIHGWLKTTSMTQYLWIKQAFPQWIKLCKIQLKYWQSYLLQIF